MGAFAKDSFRGYHSLYEYYLSRTVINENGCMMWQGTTRGLPPLQYPQATIHGWKIGVHRFIAFTKWTGLYDDYCAVIRKMEESLKIAMHTCDTPMCINPEHLIVGYTPENIQRAYNLGRKKPNKTNCTISPGDALIIKQRYWSTNVTQQELADMYEVKQPEISRIVNDMRWDN